MRLLQLEPVFGRRYTVPTVSCFSVSTPGIHFRYVQARVKRDLITAKGAQFSANVLGVHDAPVPASGSAKRRRE